MNRAYVTALTAVLSCSRLTAHAPVAMQPAAARAAADATSGAAKAPALEIDLGRERVFGSGLDAAAESGRCRPPQSSDRLQLQRRMEVPEERRHQSRFRAVDRQSRRDQSHRTPRGPRF